MKKILIISLTMAILVFALGCTITNPTQALKSLPEIQKFLEAHPNADINIVLLDGEYILNNNLVSEACLPVITTGNEYYKGTVNEGTVNITVWMDHNFKMLCMTKQNVNVAAIEVQEKITNPTNEQSNVETEQNGLNCPVLSTECSEGTIIKTTSYNGGSLDGCPYYDCCGDRVCMNTEKDSGLCLEDCKENVQVTETQSACPEKMYEQEREDCKYDYIQTTTYNGGSLDGCPYYDCCGDGKCMSTEAQSGKCSEDCKVETTNVDESGCSETLYAQDKANCKYDYIKTSTYNGGMLDGCPYYDCCGDGSCTGTEQSSGLCPQDCSVSRCPSGPIGDCNGKWIQDGTYHGGSLDGCSYYKCESD